MRQGMKRLYAAAVQSEQDPNDTHSGPSRTAGRVQLVLLLLPVVLTAVIAGWQIADHYL